MSKISQEQLHLEFWNLVQMLGMTCCIVRERISLLMLTISFICPFFFLSNQIFCNRFLGFYESQSLQISYTSWKWPSILWNRKPRCWDLFLPSCSIFPFPISQSSVMHREICQRFLKNYCAKDFDIWYKCWVPYNGIFSRRQIFVVLPKKTWGLILLRLATSAKNNFDSFPRKS